MNEESIFTKIIKGEISSYKVYEDELTIAFLPLHPKALGHVLVVPKNPVDQFFNLPEPDYQALMQTVKKVSNRMNQVLRPKRIGLKVIGVDVSHAHIHVLAFDNIEQYNEEEDISLSVDHARLKEIAAKLAF